MGDPYFHIYNQDYRLEFIQRWRKSNEWAIRDRGRWGPKWLHRLVLSMAKNLGMLGHMAFYQNETTVRNERIEIRDRAFGEAIFAAAKPFLDRGDAPGDLIVMCGHDRLMDGKMTCGWEFYYRAEVTLGGVRGVSQVGWHGFDIVVVPQLVGLIVVPKGVIERAIAKPDRLIAHPSP